MNGSSQECVSVNMGCLKAALIARAKAERSTVSSVVRRAVSRELGLDEPDVGSPAVACGPFVNTSIRFRAEEVELLTRNARGAKLGRGAYLVSLMAGADPGTSAETRAKLLAALSASNTELANLSHALFTVASLLRQQSAPAALEYRDTLLGMRRSVTHHLGLAASMLAECRPWRRGSASQARRDRRRPS